jgi:glycosyltransferase involved in cell wall biosynthesis
MRQVIFLQSKFPENLSELKSLFERWDRYGRIVHEKTGEPGVWLFSSKSSNSQNDPKILSQFINHFVSVESRSKNFSRIIALSHEIRKSKTSFTLICGGNQKSLLIGIYLKLKFRSKARLQCQFHGDTYSFNFNSGFRGFLRVCLSRLSIIFSDSIRIVSQFQKEEIVAFAPKSNQKFVLAPIPIDYSRIATPCSEKPIDLAFVGRLHAERGIGDLIKIIREIKVVSPTIKIVLAGDGPLRKEIEKQFHIWIESGELVMSGYLDGEQMHNLYSKTKVLLSTAPREGYGLTLREAALSQVHVIARESKGVIEAQRLYPQEIVSYSTIPGAVALILTALDLKVTNLKSNGVISQQKLDSKSLDLLVNSWLSD